MQESCPDLPALCYCEIAKFKQTISLKLNRCIIGVEGMISKSSSAQLSPHHSAVSLHLSPRACSLLRCPPAPPAFLIILLLACQNASAILDGGLGLSADQLIDESRGDYVLDLGIPATPQESREIWEKESGIDFSSTENLGLSASTPQASRSSVQTGQALEYSTESSSSMAPGTPSISKEPSRGETISGGAASGRNGSLAASAAGNWTFRLRDSKTAILALTLYQSGGVVFGSGSMNEGGDTMRAQASGGIEGENMSLDVTTWGDMRLYRLSLSAGEVSSGGSTSGSASESGPGSASVSVRGGYQAFSAGGAHWAGTAEGEKRID